MTLLSIPGEGVDSGEGEFVEGRTTGSFSNKSFSSFINGFSSLLLSSARTGKYCFRSAWVSTCPLWLPYGISPPKIEDMNLLGSFVRLS